MTNILFFETIFFIKFSCFKIFSFSGFFAAFVASFFWMAAMTKFDVSHAYPIIVGGLAILTSVIAIVFLKEPISLYKIIGLLLIVIGVYFLGKVS